MKPIRKTIFFFLLCALPGFAEEAGVQQIVEQYHRARPTKAELSIFTLDWAPTLDVALRRGKEEKRPIFFIWLTNYNGPSNFYSGHC